MFSIHPAISQTHALIYSFIHFLDSLIFGGSRGQQIELEPPSISILCYKGWMLCWDAKARPTKIFYVISPSSSGTASRPLTNRCSTEQFFGCSFVGHSCHMSIPTQL